MMKNLAWLMLLAIVTLNLVGCGSVVLIGNDHVTIDQQTDSIVDTKGNYSENI